MSGSPSILDTFFQECEDLIDALTEGLSEMADGQTDDNTVNAVFRAVHSIKGAAGAFKLTDLVGFAHKFETVLDGVRSHTIEAEGELMRVLQRAGDILSDLVDAARDDTGINEEAVDSTAEALQSFLGEEQEEMSDEDFSFDAVGVSLSLPTIDAGPVRFSIRFEPQPELFQRGHEPLFIFAALDDLGTLLVTADLTTLPDSIDSLDWEKCHIAWDMELETDSSEAAILEAFDFVEGLCTVTLKVLDPQDGSGAQLPFLSLPDISGNAGADMAQSAPTDDDAAPNAEPSDRKSSMPTDTVSPADAAFPAKTKPAVEKVQTEARPTLRVDLERVDRLINSVGELIINQAAIAQRIEGAGFAAADDILIDLEDYKLLAREIQEGVMAIRAQPVKPLFQRMSRIVREASDATGKTVNFVTDGEGTEVDKTVVERLADPLTHMIRNAIDHGIESTEKRALTDKDPVGTIRLSAQHRSGSVLIEVSDDGAGLNRARIREIAVKKGIVPPDAELSVSEIDNLLFAPGFSTAAEVTNLSGRGVGMDVVKTAITSLGGRITISSTEGKGTSFSISLPLTLAVMDGMIITVAGQTMVVPIASVLETVRPTESELSAIGRSGPLLQIRGAFVPIIDLAESLGHPPSETALRDKVFLLVSTERMTQCALAVDGISDQRQVVIKSLQGNYGDIPGISAATILGDGKIALILDPDAIASTAAPRGPVVIDYHLEREMQNA